MAIKVTKEVVCDLGDRHGGEIRTWRMTTDGESKTMDLCATCSRPLTRLWGRAGQATKTSKRGRVYDMSEVVAAQQK